ncbi:lipase [Xylariaceae sp. FL0804]|nr:lipase [Xylariaceae sp. FL0804]
MARGATRWMLGLGALLFGVLAVSHGPAREFILRTKEAYGFSGPPTVADRARGVRYIGSRSSAGVEHFQNLFYAQDTSGKNRFAPPVPVQNAAGSVIDGTRPGAWCPQGTGDVLPFTSRVTNVSENCLSLRIARPSGTKPDAKLPVVVWTHGGGHALGSAYEVLYEPDGLVKQAAADSRPLLFVAINYRLGIFGFATSDLMIEEKQTNAGLRDQRAALEWVRENIDVFGGDPMKVTAIGQSVGANDVSFQLLAFGGTRGAPFQQAMLMSGGPGMNFKAEPELVKERTAEVARVVGCDEGNDPSAATLECLRKAPVETLTNLSVTASRAAHPPFGEAYFYPTVDGDFFPDRPSNLLRSGKFAKGVSVIASWVTNDGAWYAPPPTASDDAVLARVALWLPGLSDSTRATLLQLYPLQDFVGMVRPDYDGPMMSPQYYRAAQILRDFWFTCPAIGFAWQYVRHHGGGAEAARNTTWLYEHNATRFSPVYEAMGVPMWRVAHLSDIPYVFNIQRLGGGADNSAAQLELARAMSRRIAEFVTSGTPAGDRSDAGGTGEWPPAFSDATESDLRQDSPGRLSLALFDEREVGLPVAVVGDDEFATATGVARDVGWERLIKRCGYINSQKVIDEVGW